MSSTLRLRVPRRLTDEQVRRLCTGLAEQLTAGAATAVVCRVERPVGDLATVDVVARLALVARRAGVTFWLDSPDAELASLLGLVGLRAALARLPDDR